MDIEEIQKLMGLLEASSLSKMTIKQKDFEVHLEKGGGLSYSLPPHPVPAAPYEVKETPPPPAKDSPQGTYVTSPMVGTFYASASPDEPAFVRVGDTVKGDGIVCIIEAMKVMNEVKAGVSGTIAEVLIENGQPVEFGTRLFRIV